MFAGFVAGEWGFYTASLGRTESRMETPHTVFRRTLAETRAPMAAIKAIREQFGLTVPEAKEVWLQVTVAAASLEEHQANLSSPLIQVLGEKGL